MAIEQVVGHHYELDDFQIRRSPRDTRRWVRRSSSSARTESLFERGISTEYRNRKRAYLNALNKIVYEENDTPEKER